MIRRILQLLLQHLNLFTKDVRFQELYAHVQAKAANIESMLTQWQGSNYHLGSIKLLAENAFVEQLMLLKDLVTISLNERGDTASLQALDGFYNQIRKGSINQRLSKAERMLHIAEASLPELRKYAKGQELYDNALKAFDDFKNLGHKPSEHRTENAIRKEYLYDEVIALSRFIQLQLRVLVKTYRGDHPEFYDTFMAFSKINSSKVNKEKMAVDEDDAQSNRPTSTSEIASPQAAEASPPSEKQHNTQSTSVAHPPNPKTAADTSKSKKKIPKSLKAPLNGQSTNSTT